MDKTRQTGRDVAAEIAALAGDTTDAAALARDPLDAWDARAVGPRVVVTLITMDGRSFRCALDPRSAHHFSNVLLAAAGAAQLAAQGGA